MASDSNFAHPGRFPDEFTGPGAKLSNRDRFHVSLRDTNGSGCQWQARMERAAELPRTGKCPVRTQSTTSE
jgi:hypothetical protein